LGINYEKLIKQLLDDPLWAELQNRHRQLLEDGWPAIEQQLTTRLEEAVNQDDRLQPLHRRQLLDKWYKASTKAHADAAFTGLKIALAENDYRGTARVDQRLTDQHKWLMYGEIGIELAKRPGVHALIDWLYALPAKRLSDPDGGRLADLVKQAGGKQYRPKGSEIEYAYAVVVVDKRIRDGLMEHLNSIRGDKPIKWTSVRRLLGALCKCRVFDHLGQTRHGIRYGVGYYRQVQGRGTYYKRPLATRRRCAGPLRRFTDYI